MATSQTKNSTSRPKIMRPVTTSAKQRFKIKGNQPAVQTTKRLDRLVKTSKGIGSRLLGAQPGNDNYLKGKLWRQAIINALEKRGRGDRMAALEAVATKLINLSLWGSMPAIRELGDRVEGKAAQMLVGDPENPLQFNDQTQLSNSARVTRLMQVLALESSTDSGKAIFVALKAKKLRPKIVKKK